LYDVYKGNAQPNRISWLLVGAFAMLAFFSSRDEGAGAQAYFTLVTGLNPLAVVVLSFFNKKAYWRITKRDYSLGAVAVLSAIVWFATGEGAIALIFAIIADFFAGLPTLIKAYQKPESESGLLFAICILTSGITLLTISDWTFANFAFPAYILGFCGLMVYSIYIRPRDKSKH